MNTYTTIVGMEIHVELKTQSKMFCGCRNDPFGAEKPNIYTCPVCLGLPGALPVPNQKAIDWTIKLGLALNCEIAEFSKFDRKHYFYPDLPKGYQISQYDQPIARNGWLEIEMPVASSQLPESANKLPETGDRRHLKRIGIRRVHLEEDTGKLQHATVEGKRVSLIDFNRSGVPLVEIVTESDIRSGEEAKLFLKKLHQIIRCLEISDADMEKGSMRLEPNISVAQVSGNRSPVTGDNLPPYKVEVKNINSFNFVKKAIEYETARHTEILEKGETPVQETRGYNEDKGITVSQRRKEEANDYRYFPDPDIPPLRFSKDKIASIKADLPELPDAKSARFIREYSLEARVSEQLVESRLLADYFEQAAAAGKARDMSPVKLANWILNKKVDIVNTSVDKLLKEISAASTTANISEAELSKLVREVLAENPKAVEDYKKGKEQVLMFLVGMVMKKAKVRIESNRLVSVIKLLL